MGTDNQNVAAHMKTLMGIGNNGVETLTDMVQTDALAEVVLVELWTTCQQTQMNMEMTPLIIQRSSPNVLKPQGDVVIVYVQVGCLWPPKKVHLGTNSMHLVHQPRNTIVSE